MCAFIRWSLLKSTINISHHAQMFAAFPFPYFPCVFIQFIGFFSMIARSLCVRVGGSSTLGPVTGSGLWGSRLRGHPGPCGTGGFHATAMMRTPLFVRVSKVPATASQELSSAPTSCCGRPTCVWIVCAQPYLYAKPGVQC